MKRSNMLYIVVLGCIITLLGCNLINSNDDSDDQEQNIEGLWELNTDDETIYVLIDESSITVYSKESNADCYFIQSFDILSTDGDTLTISSVDTQENEEVTIVREGETIRITRMDDGETIEEVYSMSNEDILTLTPKCEVTISGLWQLESTEDIFYVFINLNDNSVILVDYRGDAANQGDDCYEFQQYTITNIDGNVYTIENAGNPNDAQDVIIELVDEDMHVTRQGEQGPVMETYFRSNEDPVSFQPECQTE